MINITTSRRKIMKTQPSCTSRYINQAHKFKHGAQVKKYFFQLVLCFLLLLVMGKFKIYYIIMRETKKVVVLLYTLSQLLQRQKEIEVLWIALCIYNGIQKYTFWSLSFRCLRFNHRTLFFLFFSSLMLEEEREITNKGRDERNIFQL